MKYRMIRLVIVALAVLSTVSCDINQPHEVDKPEPKPQPDSVDVRVEIIHGETEVRISSATILFDSTAVEFDGLLTQKRLEQDVDIDVTARADGFQEMAEPRVINLSSDVSITIRLWPIEDDEPEPEGPGKVTIDAQCDEASSAPRGLVTVSAENGFSSVKLLDSSTREVIKKAAQLTPEKNQEYTFSDVPNGDYLAVAKLNDIPSESANTALLDCQVEQPEGPGSITIVKNDCSDEGADNGLLTVRIENGADFVKITKNGELVKNLKHTRANPVKNQEETFDGVPSGNFKIVAGLNDQTSQKDVTVETCESKPPEGPGNIDANVRCEEEDGTVTFTVENGFTRYRFRNLTADETVKAEQDIKLRFEITFRDLADGEYRFISRLNGQKSTKDVTIGCDVANKPPKADFSFETNNLEVDFTDQSSDSDGQIVQYQWEFGDGGMSNEENPSYTYDSPGSYDVTEKVTDDDGATDTKTRTVTVTRPEGPGNMTAENIRCSDNDGTVTMTIEKGANFVRILDPDDAVVAEQTGLTPVAQQTVQFTGLPDGDFTPVAGRNNGTDPVKGAVFTVDCDVETTYQEYAQELNFDFQQGSFTSGFNGKERDLLVEVIEVIYYNDSQTPENPQPVGEVTTKLRALADNSQAEQLAAIEYSCANNTVFQTPTFSFTNGTENGWKVLSRQNDAENFASMVKCDITLVDKGNDTGSDTFRISNPPDEIAKIVIDWDVEVPAQNGVAPSAPKMSSQERITAQRYFKYNEYGEMKEVSKEVFFNSH